MIEPAVPPQMMLEVVGALPVRLEIGEPVDALTCAALHLEHVRNGMGRPEVALVDIDGIAPRGLRQRVVAELLVRKTATGEHCPPAGKLSAVLRERFLDLARHDAGPAKPEGVEMMQAQGQDVAGVLVEDLLPDGERAVVVALDPVTQGSRVGLLAPVCAAEETARRFQRLLGDRNVGLLEGQHHQVALQHVGEGEVRVGGECRLEVGADIRAIAQIAPHGRAEGLGRSSARGRQGQSVQV